MQGALQKPGIEGDKASPLKAFMDKGDRHCQGLFRQHNQLLDPWQQGTLGQPCFVSAALEFSITQQLRDQILEFIDVLSYT